jgi:hypothetical protein
LGCAKKSDHFLANIITSKAGGFLPYINIVFKLDKVQFTKSKNFILSEPAKEITSIKREQYAHNDLKLSFEQATTVGLVIIFLFPLIFFNQFLCHDNKFSLVHSNQKPRKRNSEKVRL